MSDNTMYDVQNLKAAAVWLGAIFLNGVSMVSKSDVSFSLSCTVSILAIVYYIIQIKKNSKK